MHYKVCEICGTRSGRSDGQKRMFMAKFPLDEDRCKQWVKVTGKEDLVYVPIEKLHQLKHVCGRHFKLKDFKKKKTQLRKKAIPSVELTAVPLADELLVGFPLHIAETKRPELPNIFTEHDYCCHRDDTEQLYADAEQPKEDGPFLWQRLTEEVVPLDEKLCSEDETLLGESQLVPALCDPEKIKIQTELSCNVCNEPITGFRYACVQCCNWDLCGACEARGEHATHYVLRVPPHRSSKETQGVLTALRQMLKEALHEDPSVPDIKEDVKIEYSLCEDEAPQETSAEPVGDAARASALSDPSGAADPAAKETEIDEAEYLKTESEASISLGEDSIIDVNADVPKDAVCITHQKRKLNGAGHSYTVPQKVQKRNDQGLLRLHNTSELISEEESKVPGILSTEDISAPQRESPTESSLSVENVMELSSLALSASEAQYMTLDGQPLEVIDYSKEQCVNVTRVTVEERDPIRDGTARGKEITTLHIQQDHRRVRQFDY